MSTLGDRERLFKKRFVLDQELRFKAEARRNKLLGEWAAGKFDLRGPAVGDYIRVCKVHVAKGNDEVFRKLLRDFGAIIDAHELRRMMDFLVAAVMEIRKKSIRLPSSATVGEHWKQSVARSGSSRGAEETSLVSHATPARHVQHNWSARFVIEAITSVAIFEFGHCLQPFARCAWQNDPQVTSCFT